MIPYLLVFNISYYNISEDYRFVIENSLNTINE
jgi:hypothetical protein